MTPQQRVAILAETLASLPKDGTTACWAYQHTGVARPRSDVFTPLHPAEVLLSGPCPDVQVYNCDTFDAALALRRDGFSQDCIAVLDMASFQEPGGGCRRGARAQEEDLCRRSGLAPVLEAAADGKYPLPLHGALYVANVPIVRSSEEHGYAWLRAPYPRVNVLVSAAICVPALPDGGAGIVCEHPTTVFTDEGLAITRQKIMLMLAIAAKGGNTALVLGAYGCGAYGNPPHQVASLFKEVLDRHGAHFRRVVFAVLSTKDNTNYSVFRDVLAL